MGVISAKVLGENPPLSLSFPLVSLPFPLTSFPILPLPVFPSLGGLLPYKNGVVVVVALCANNQPTFSLFVAERSYIYCKGNMEKFWEENVRSTPTSITSG